MDNCENQTSVLTLKDLCIYLLRRWKFVVVCFLFFGISLSLYGALSLKTQYPTINTAALDEEKTAIQDEIDALSASLLEKESSLLTAENNLEISKHELETLSSTISKKKDLLASQKQELEAVQRNYSEVESLIEKAQELYDYTKDSETKAALLSQIRSGYDRKSDLLGKEADLKAEIIATEATIEELSLSKTLKNSIRQSEDSIESLNTEISDLQEQLEKKETELAEFDTKYASVPIVPTLTDRIKKAIKTGSVGVILGLVLSCGLLFLKFYFSPFVLSSRELSCLTNTDYSPSLLHSDYKGIQGLVDRWAGSFSDKDLDMQLKLLADNISIKSQDIVITGTGDPAVLQKVTDSLLPLIDKDCHLAFIPCPVYNPSLISSLKGKSILYVESLNKSRKKDIIALVKLMESYRISVIGSITL